MKFEMVEAESTFVKVVKFDSPGCLSPFEVDERQLVILYPYFAPFKQPFNQFVVVAPTKIEKLNNCKGYSMTGVSVVDFLDIRKLFIDITLLLA